MSKSIHIVSFDVPYPPNYGGVIDVFYKVKALQSLGVNVILHCFEYGRSHSKELEKVCSEVHYYDRKMGKLKLFHQLPYIVVTRNSSTLLERLLKDKHPILFEGLHTCFHLRNPLLKKRKLFVRAHNIEHDYYEELARTESSKFKKLYFESEAKKLKRFEAFLNKADKVFAISKSDEESLNSRYENVALLPPFHAFEQTNCKDGNGNYALYHGNLAVGENHLAAMFLITQVFTDPGGMKLVIAGNNPKAELIEACARNKNVKLDSNISTEEIHNLISDAQINILPTFQATGLKLKLLAALYLGRHCLVNKPMVENTGLEKLCTIANSADEFKAALSKLANANFSPSNINERKEVLDKHFSNKANGSFLASFL